MKTPKPLKKLAKVEKFYLKQNGICPLCNLSMKEDFYELETWILNRLRKIPATKKRTRINLNFDHIIPLSKGGKDKLSNKQLTHAKCNSKKGNNI